MILLIDVGNSIITIGLHNGQIIEKTFMIETKKIKTKDEFALFLISILNLNNIDKETIIGASIASVVPSINNALIESLKVYFNIKPIIIEPGIKMGIKLKVDNPKEVGADLIADALAGHIKYKKNLLIINCGTATKYSVITEAGEFIGVAIAPGFQIGSEGLFKKTAQLPDVGLKMPKEPIGKNSVEAIASGLFYSYACSIKSYIALIKETYGNDLIVILTGGISRYFSEYLKKEIHYADINLTLEGLKIIYDKNKNETT
ncbi:MAG: type III pantothenate kinase [Firmicutes bacterium]|nr:type III pantothenate kinase [Bacillota bacterium]